MSETLATKIADIYEISEVSYFSSLFYLLIAIILIAMLAGFLLYKRKQNFRKSWQYIAQSEITLLSQQDIVTNKELFPLIKKIALYKFSRTEIANLHGKKWLDWLTVNLSNKIKWQDYSEHLNRLYEPDALIFDKKEFAKIIKEVKKWV